MLNFVTKQWGIAAGSDDSAAGKFNFQDCKVLVSVKKYMAWQDEQKRGVAMYEKVAGNFPPSKYQRHAAFVAPCAFGNSAASNDQL